MIKRARYALVTAVVAWGVHAQWGGAARAEAISAVQGIERKWHPGHYVIGRSLALMEEALASEHITGWKVGCSWRRLEPEAGQYDFSALDALLEITRKHGKQVFFQVGERAFGTDKRPLPDYLYSDPAFGGGVQPKVGSKNKRGDSGSVARLWDPAVVERLNLLIRALGARYDSDPNVAGLVIGDESALGIDFTKAEGYSHQAYADGLISIQQAMVEAFPSSVVLQGMNWGPDTLVQVIDHMRGTGAGMVAPDLVPEQGRFDYAVPSKFYPYFTKNSGTFPVAMDVQREDYFDADWMEEFCASNPGSYPCHRDRDGNLWRSKGRFTLEDIYDMGLHTLGLNFIFWQMNPKDDGFGYIAEYDEVLEYIASREGEINAELPTCFKGSRK